MTRRSIMDISVENKGRDCFDVRIGGIDEGQTPTTRLPYYTKVMNHVIARMDDYYGADGLVGTEWKFAEDNEDEIEAIIEACWSADADVPSDADITDNVERWLKEII